MWEIQNKRLLIVLSAAICLLMMGCNTGTSLPSEEIPVFKGLNIVKTATAGDPVRLKFLISEDFDANLQLNNSFGSVFLSPKQSDGGLEFVLPDPIVQVAGQCSWQLIHDNQAVLQGDIWIHPRSGSGMRMESYLGPKDIIAGTSDHAMVVAIPTDRFDNPLPDGTPIQIEERFKGQTISFRDSIDHLISWRNIEPKTTSGRAFFRSLAGNSSSLEMYADISSGAATDFEINFERNHDFADGNQVILLKTSVIKDRFENTIADGTLVTFHIESTIASGLYTNATTINGVAIAKIVHPDAETKWNISAFIAGVATSNTLELEFNSAVEDFTVAFSDKTHIISIGPVSGFMGQLVPDFTPAEITMIYEDGREERITLYTREGNVQLDTKTHRSKTPPIHYEIRILGRTKTINL